MFRVLLSPSSSSPVSCATMVSFSCEGCNDTVKKPKLPQHYNNCGAPFTCELPCAKNDFHVDCWYCSTKFKVFPFERLVSETSF